MKESNHQAQLSHRDGGRCGRVPGSCASEATMLGGPLLDPLLAAGSADDALVRELLKAYFRKDHAGIVEVAGRVAGTRGPVNEFGGTEVKSPHPEPVYKDKLLAAIHREEVLLGAIASASARGERSTLLLLCRELAMNRKKFDSEFQRKTISTSKEPDL